MAGVSFGLADFVTGGPIVDLPVNKGASWAAQLNRPDELSCTVNLRDPANRALDLRTASEPKKTVLVARTDDDVILAWGIIGGREWDEDAKTLSLNAGGVWSEWFGSSIVAPASARTAPLIVNGPDGFPVINPALDTALSGWSLGTIGKKLVEQRLAWPGAPAIFELPPDEVGTREREYLFSDLKSVGSALTDLTGVENGPDFAFDAARSSDGLSLRYIMRHGSESQPRLGTDLGGVWGLGKLSPITKFKAADSGAVVGSAAWLTAGRSSGGALVARSLNDALIAAGYPPMDAVDTSHSDVSVQATLDEYAAELIRFAAAPTRDVSFTVRADASPALGAYRPGDTMTLDVPDDHPFLVGDVPIRITSISGDERGKTVDVGCVILDA